MSHHKTIKTAIAAAGGEDAFMRALGIKRRTLFYWRADGIPAVRLKAVSEATGIAAHLLRPDLFEFVAKPAADIAA
jgi:DNA-binding transcriptional regulator YdaS (Cro superfamily)